MMTMLRQTCMSALAITVALALPACGSVRYAEQYVLEFAPVTPPQARPTSAFGPLVLRELGCPPYLCEDRLVYREGPYRIGFYDYHRWAVDPRAALTRLVADRIRASSLFESVAVERTAARDTYLLRGDIERFEEVDGAAAVQAICTIAAEIVDLKTRSVIWSGTVSETVPVQQRDVAGVVAALSAASQAVADGLVASMVNELSATRAPGNFRVPDRELTGWLDSQAARSGLPGELR
jgi:ABC-type uncharacterized transport system auxiliary subunit